MHDPHGDLIRPNLVKEMRVDGVQGSGTLNSKDISSKVENGSSLEVPQSASAEGEESRKPNIAKRPTLPANQRSKNIYRYISSIGRGAHIAWREKASRTNTEIICMKMVSNLE